MQNSLPSNWHQVTIAQYRELAELESEQLENKFELITEQLAILLDTSTDDDVLAVLDIDEMFEMFSKVQWLQSPIPKSIAEEHNGLRLKKWNDLTLGEFIDIENLVVQDPHNNIEKLCAIVYRQYKTDDWGKQQLEPYQYDVFDRAEQFLSMPITKGLGLLTSYMDFRKSFMGSYDSLFQPEDSKQEAIEGEEELTGLELLNHKKEVRKQQQLAKWSWESTIWNLSNQDITKFEQIFNTKLILVFNVLSMRMLLGD